MTTAAMAYTHPGMILSLSLLKGGLLGGHCALLIAIGAGLAYAGPLGAANAAIAVALVLVFMTTGQVVHRATVASPSANGLMVVLVSYAIRVSLLAGLMVIATRWSQLEQVLIPEVFLFSAVFTSIVWMLALVLTHNRLRIPIYDSAWPGFVAESQATETPRQVDGNDGRVDEERR